MRYAVLYSAMSAGLSKDDFGARIAGAAGAIRAHSEELSALDSVGGDGDHGATMVRIMERLRASFESSADFQSAMREAGWAVLGADGGASGAVFGSFFLGMAGALNEPLDAPALATAFEAGLAAVCRQTKATPGDKTALDALVPAVHAARRAADHGKSAEDALGDAAAAARAGAESTRNLIARQGRAKYAGERTRGHCDPGAVSAALIFEGFCGASIPAKEGAEHA